MELQCYEYIFPLTNVLLFRAVVTQCIKHFPSKETVVGIDGFCSITPPETSKVKTMSEGTLIPSILIYYNTISRS
jgi:hypothetical protein